MLSMLRLENDGFNPNSGAGALDKTDKDEVIETIDTLVSRAWGITDLSDIKELATTELKERVDEVGEGSR